jgi:hypothetical protein
MRPRGRFAFRADSQCLSAWKSSGRKLYDEQLLMGVPG